ncbi:MAG: FecR domain-containing protein [Paenibacillaceae bacterium]
MGIRKRLSILLCTTLMFSLVLGTVTPAFAKSTREAIIESVVGEVNVTKAGGSKSYRAFEGMTLNQGDHIQTGVGSKVVLRIVDHDDEVTIDEKSSMYISELSENTKGKKSKVKMWAGSLWGKVKTLAGADDEFEVETPTAVMGVRGTNLLVGVDPETGESKFYIASGQGQVSKKGEEDPGSGTTLNPNEQIALDKDTNSDDFDDYKNVADLDDLITNTSDAIIEAIIASKAAIDQENEQFIEKLQKEQDETGESNQEAIDRINQNLDNLVGNIVKSAISQNKVDEAAIKEFIAKINEQLDEKLDLDNVKAQELSDAEKAKQAQVKLLEEERKHKQEAEKLKQEELKKQNEELQKKLKEQLEKQKAEKEKAAEAAKKKAAEEHVKKLADPARLAFEAKQKALADEKAKQDAVAKAAKDAAAAEAAADAEAARLKAIADAAAAEAAENANNNDDNDEEPLADPQLFMEIIQDVDGVPAKLNIYVKDFEDLGVYAAQLHFTHSSDIDAYGTESTESEIFTEDDPEFVNLIRDSYYVESDISMVETMFVVTKYDSNDIDVVGKKLLVSIYFDAYEAGTITLTKAIIVDHTGVKHEFDIVVTEVPIEVTNTGR